MINMEKSEESRRVIFLDIDGVLATWTEYGHFGNKESNKFQEENSWAKELNVKYPFSKECVKVLNEIFEIYSDIKIVISSDWRKYWSLEQLKTIFVQNGLTKCPEEKTEDNGNHYSSSYEKIRLGQIESYLIKHQMLSEDGEKSDKKWIIIDDLNMSYLLPQKLKRKMVWTNEFDGLCGKSRNNFSEENRMSIKDLIIKTLK